MHLSRSTNLCGSHCRFAGSSHPHSVAPEYCLSQQQSSPAGRNTFFSFSRHVLAGNEHARFVGEPVDMLIISPLCREFEQAINKYEVTLTLYMPHYSRAELLLMRCSLHQFQASPFHYVMLNHAPLHFASAMPGPCTSNRLEKQASAGSPQLGSCMPLLSYVASWMTCWHASTSVTDTHRKVPVCYSIKQSCAVMSSFVYLALSSSLRPPAQHVDMFHYIQ